MSEVINNLLWCLQSNPWLRACLLIRIQQQHLWSIYVYYHQELRQTSLQGSPWTKTFSSGSQQSKFLVSGQEKVQVGGKKYPSGYEESLCPCLNFYKSKTCRSVKINTFAHLCFACQILNGVVHGLGMIVTKNQGNPIERLQIVSHLEKIVP